MKPIFDRLNSFSRDINIPFNMFFEKVSSTMGENLSIPERRYLELFISYGTDLSHLPLRWLQGEEAATSMCKMPYGECHNIALELLSVFEKEYPSTSPKLYWGYIDEWEGDVYEGTYEHSFLTFVSEGETVLFDPLFSRIILEKKRIRFFSHFGIHIPSNVLNTITPTANSVGKNYAGYIKRHIIHNDELINNFKKELAQS